MSNTINTNMITLQVMADDKIPAGEAMSVTKYGWKSTLQTYPTGMYGDPVRFAKSLREALPEVNNLRIPWNEHSLDKSGHLHPQFEAFLSEASKQGFKFTFTYASNEFQQLGQHGETAQAVYDGLVKELAIAKPAYENMIDRIADLGLSNSVFGYDLVSEPYAFLKGSYISTKPSYTATREFVGLYLDTVQTLGNVVQSKTDSKVLVDGLGYASNFAALNRANLNGVQKIRDWLGDDLIWSFHTHGGLSGVSNAKDPNKFITGLDKILSPLGNDNIIVTETYLPNQAADNFKGADGALDFYQTVGYQYFADRGIAVGWFPGATIGTGGGHLVDVAKNGEIAIRNQHSYAHANNAFSLGDDSAKRSGNQNIKVDLKDVMLRDQSLNIERGVKMGTAFGYDGNDTLTGTDGSNDFLYGGTGNDVLDGKGNNDFLFGQDGDDRLISASGNNHFYGGAGNDTIVGGTGTNQMQGGSGTDHFILSSKGNNTIIDFDPSSETIEFNEGFANWQQLRKAMTVVDYDGDGIRDDVRIDHGNNTATYLRDTALAQLGADDFIFASPQLTVGVQDTTRYGNNTKRVDVVEADNNATFNFDGTGQALTLTFKGYDIDTKNELGVYLDGKLISSLSGGRSNNNKNAEYTIDLSADQAGKGTHVLEFKQMSNAKYVWGVSDILLETAKSTPTDPTLKIGIADTTHYGNNTKHVDVVEKDSKATFNFDGTGEALTLTFDGYDIDARNELGVYLDGKLISSLSGGRSNNNKHVEYKVDLSADQASKGGHVLEFKQMSNAKYVWGVSDILLEADKPSNPTLTVGTADTTIYGNNNKRIEVIEDDNKASFNFEGTGKALKLTFDGFDVDVAKELGVYLDGELISSLSGGRSNNNRYVEYTVDLSADQVGKGTHVLEFEQMVNPAYTWGVSDIILEDISIA